MAGQTRKSSHHPLLSCCVLASSYPEAKLVPWSETLQSSFYFHKNQADLSHKAHCCQSPLPITHGLPSSATCLSSSVPVDESPAPPDLASSLPHLPCIPFPSPQDTHSPQGGASIPDTFLPLLIVGCTHWICQLNSCSFIHSFRLTSLVKAPKCLTKNI